MKILIENIGKDQDVFLENIFKGTELWCCERNLGSVLRQLFPNEEILHDKYLTLSDKKFRPDYQIPKKKIVVEFQGYQHYTDTICMYKDNIKYNTLKSNGW